MRSSNRGGLAGLTGRAAAPGWPQVAPEDLGVGGRVEAGGSSFWWFDVRREQPAENVVDSEYDEFDEVDEEGEGVEGVVPHCVMGLPRDTSWTFRMAQSHCVSGFGMSVKMVGVGLG